MVLDSINTNRIRFVVLFFFFLWIDLSCSDRHSFNVYVNDVYSLSNPNSSLGFTEKYLDFELLYINNSDDTLYIKDQYVNVDGYLDNENPVLKTTFLCIKGDTLYGNRCMAGVHLMELKRHKNLDVNLRKIYPNQRMQVRFVVPQSAIHKLYLRKYSNYYDEEQFLFFIADNAVLVTNIYQNGSFVEKRLSGGFGDYMRLETIPFDEIPVDLVF